MSQLLGQLRRQRARLHAPSPIPAIKAWGIHPSFTAQSEHVLHGHDRQAGYRSLRRADKGPVNAIVLTSQVGFHILLFLGGGSSGPPSDGRVIVVSSGVDNLVGSKTLRQVNMCPRV